jgi:hypothetical protein
LKQRQQKSFCSETAIDILGNEEKKKDETTRRKKTKLISTAGWTAKFRVPADRFQEVPVMFIT